MKYRELLRLYKTGQISDDIKKEVEREIEKHEAIDEYLCDKDDIIDEIVSFNEPQLDDNIKENDKELSIEINKSIKKAFRKMGIIVAVTVLVILLIIETVLPRATNIFWYNPSKNINNDGREKISLDMSIYTDLCMPNNLYNDGYAKAEGYGKYTFTLVKNIFDEDKSQQIAGEIIRNKLILYNPQQFKLPIGNAFAWRYYTGLNKNKSLNEQIKIIKDDICMDENLESLKDEEKYRAYVSFNKILGYKQAYKFAKKNVKDGEVWLAIDCGDDFYIDNLTNIGMSLAFAGSVEYGEIKGYPMLTGETKDKPNKEENLKDEKFAKGHFLSMMKYIKDQKKFRTALGSYGRIHDISDKNFDEGIKYIDKNGLKSYGMSIYTTKEKLIELSKNNMIFNIMIEY